MSVDYSRESIMSMHPESLRGMIRERGHHTVEIQLYEALAKGKPLADDTGIMVRGLLDAWRERGLSEDHPDIEWVKRLLDMAEQAKKGNVDLSPFAWKPFHDADREVARKLIFERRSVRHWTDEEVPDSMVERILEAGLWAAHGCNLNTLRFLVVHEKAEPGLFRGADIPGGPLHIVACQDVRPYYVQPGYVRVPTTLEKNKVLDCGAAMQNMVLMAHALGLGACWLTFRGDMISRLRARFNLDEKIEAVTYLDLGFPAQTPMPPGRITTSEAILAWS